MTSEEFAKPVGVGGKKENTTSAPELRKSVGSNVPKMCSSYTPPDWSSVPEFPFKFEVYKNGCLVDSFPIDGKPYYILGRSPSATDIPILHPSSSRQHCIVQHRTDGKMFLFDLGSTHGTFVNKRRAPAREFMPLRVGDMLKFGASTRLFHVVGPEELRPGETEIARQTSKSKSKPVSFTNVHNTHGSRFQPSTLKEDQGILWGQSEDAAEEVVIDEDEYLNKNKYLTPKNRHLFERLTQRCEKKDRLEKEIESFSQRKYAQGGELSEGQKYHLEGIKAKVSEMNEQIENLEEVIKERVRTSLHGGSEAAAKKRRRKHMDDEDDDYYDRTKLSKKKKTAKPVKKIETLTSVKERLAEIDMQVSNLKTKLQDAKDGESTESGEVDPLDSFMSEVQSNLSREASKKIDTELAELQKERARLTKLAEIAKPSKAVRELMERAKKHTQARAKEAAPAPSAPPKTSVSSHQALQGSLAGMKRRVEDEKRREEKLEEEEEESLKMKKQLKVTADRRKQSSKPEAEKGSRSSKGSIFGQNSDESNLNDVAGGLHIRPKRQKTDNNSENGISDEKQCLGPSKPAWISEESRTEPEWVPPSNQSGDGKTHLNEKFGY
eukprot:472506_1